MRPMKPDKEISVSTIRIPTAQRVDSGAGACPEDGRGKRRRRPVDSRRRVHCGNEGNGSCVPCGRPCQKVRRGGRFPRLSAGGSAPLSCRGRGLLFGADLYEKPCPEAGHPAGSDHGRRGKRGRRPVRGGVPDGEGQGVRQHCVSDASVSHAG